MLFHAREKRCLDEVVDDCHSQPRAARHWSTVHQHESRCAIFTDYEYLYSAGNAGSRLSGYFASSVEDLVTQTLEFTIEEVNADRNVSNNAKNRQIVLNLYEKGIFDIKDAINQVADRLNISKHTVYLYIRQFKSGDFQGQDK